ncbi:ABC transporter [Rhodococcus sp. HNM0569]|nr:ABC transporter [Rhodococcus sp. HNM0569]
MLTAMITTALVAAACTTDTGGETTASTPAGSDLAVGAGATEVDGPQPRLAVTDAHSGTVAVLDLTSGEELESLTFDNPTKVTMVDDRYAFAIDGPGGHAHVVDLGTWTVDHGDHTHSYVAEPGEIGTLDGAKPAHVVPGDGKVAVFFDGDGAAQVVDVAALDDGEVRTTTVHADGPHHGVIAPVSGHFVTSRPSGTPDDTHPGSFELRDAAGTPVSAFDDACPRMHGEAVFDDHMLGACDDGVFVAHVGADGWTSEKIAYPDGITTASRPTTFREQPGVPTVVATAGPAATNDGVLVLDSTTRQWQHIHTPDRALAAHLSGDGRIVFAVLADGTFRTYDAATGAETAAAPVLAEPYDWSDTSAVPPVIAVAGKRAYVSDPASHVVHEIDFADNARIARTLDVGTAVSSLGVAGL